MEEAKVITLIEDVENTAYKLGSVLNFAINHSVPLTRAADMLGKTVLMGLESRKTSTRIRNITRVKVGVELLDLLRAEGMISFQREVIERTPNMTDKAYDNAKKRAKYKIKTLDEAFAFKISLAFYYFDAEVPMFTQPLLKKPVKWKSFYHPVMGEMVRNTVEGVQWEFSLEKTPKVFKFMNKIRKTSFKVNTGLLDIYEQCLNDPIFTNEKKDFKPKQLNSILGQQNEILRIASSLGKQKFWLSSFLDFRGRFYYSNTYFHPQGNKVARSLFLFKKKKAIGETGWEGLLCAATSEYGHNKLPREEKLAFGVKNLPTWLKVAKNPLKLAHKDIWQRADNPFAFLSLVLEISNAYGEDGSGKFEYKSRHPIFIDASNSGTQILSALGRDMVGGKLSNLTDSSEIGDVYQFIADKVWPKYRKAKSNRKLYDTVNEKLIYYQTEMDEAHLSQDWDRLKMLQEKHATFYTDNKEDIKSCASIFWADREHLMRKLSKRPVMTIPYSAGPRTIAKSLYKDWRPEEGMKGITGTYCFTLAFDIFDAYAESMKIPTDLMTLFQGLGKRAHKKGKDLQFNTPIMNFPFVQNARKDKMEKISIIRGGKRMRLVVCVGQNEKVDYRSAVSSSSPNAIHALDAAFMMTIILGSDYPMASVHDSFATYPGDYKNLNEDVRKLFVEMFSKDKDVLRYLLLQCNAVDLYDTIEKGDLDISNVLNNGFAFDV